MKANTIWMYMRVVMAATADALRIWRSDYAPWSAEESILAEHADSVELKVVWRPGGRMTIAVVIDGRRFGTGDTYYYRANAVGGHIDLESANAKPKR